MKDRLRQLCWPLLQKFERGDTPYNYKPLNRKLLLICGLLFCSLAIAVAIIGGSTQGFAYLLPVLVFAAVGLVTLIVGSLGSDRAVSKIWGNK